MKCALDGCENDFNTLLRPRRKYCSEECRMTEQRRRWYARYSLKRHATKNCLECNKEFRTLLTGRVKYCSDHCAYRSMIKQISAREKERPRRPPHENECHRCQKTFYGRKRKYCGAACWARDKVTYRHGCHRCGIDFVSNNKRQQFCGLQCAIAAKRSPERACKGCGFMFVPKRRNSSKGLYHSRECAFAHDMHYRGGQYTRELALWADLRNAAKSIGELSNAAN